MSTNYSITLSWNNEKTKLVIPVLPEEVKVKCGTSNSKVTVAELGEIYEKGTPDCTEYSWESIFPLKQSPVVSVKKLSSPLTYINQLKKLMENQTVVHLVISGMGITDYCLITKLNFSESGEDVGTYSYNITFIKYKTVTVRKLTKSTAKKPKNKSSRPSTKATTNGKIYKVKSGDCLWGIAQAKLGNGSKWTKIYDLNSSVIISAAKKHGVSASKNYPVLYVGTILKLP